MSDEELAEKVGRALYTERPLELDQEGGDDWDILPDEWRGEWIDAGRVAVAAVKKARRLTRPRTQQPADLVQGDAKLRGNSGDADATENHNEQE